MSKLKDVLSRAAAQIDRPVVTIGNYDGVHLGHQTIIESLRARARTLGTTCVALTFEPHPVVFFGRREPATFCITRPDQKLDLLRAGGVDHPIALAFDTELAGLTPEAFVHQVLFEGLGAREVWVGYDFNFGKGRSGGTEDLRRHGEQRGIEVHIHEAVAHGERVVSSTRVRKALAAGEMAEAASLLGRPHAIRGAIEHGDARGRGLGFPTANITPTAGMMVPHGVYVSTATILDPKNGLPAGPLPAVTSIGVRPTVLEGAAPNVETYVLSGLPEGASLYDHTLDIGLLRYLRPEEKYDTVDAMVAQIDLDVAEARRHHGLA